MNQMPQPNNIAPPLNQVIAHLDPTDPEDNDIITNLDSIREKIRKEFPTPMSIVDTYRKGLIDYAWMSGGFNEEELAEILAECDRRNKEEASLQ
jgi:ribonuclease PH